MNTTPSPLNYVISHPGRFLFDVLKGFRDNQGLLLAGAVAYYTLLSIIPVFALVLIVLSQFLDQDLLLETVSTILEMAAPIRTEVLSTHLEAFLSHWKVIGTMGILLLLFFSSLAFTVLENAMSTIFFHRRMSHPLAIRTIQQQSPLQRVGSVWPSLAGCRRLGIQHLREFL